MMEYRVYPPIGIARVGNSDQHFVGPEVLHSRGRNPDGSEVTAFKDPQHRVKRQGARFRIFQLESPGAPPRPLVLPPGGSVEWSVQVVNKKDSIRRPAAPPGPIAAGTKLRPQDDDARSDRRIDSKPVQLAGEGTAALRGTHAGQPVSLGEISVDAAGRLVVLGGAGGAASHPPGRPIGNEEGERSDSFYNNRDWHDDVGDGPVTAVVRLPGEAPIVAAPGWVVVGPPDFAPIAGAIVTLFDVIRQVALERGLLPPLPDRPSFTADIYPILSRARSLRWVHTDDNWGAISDDYPSLADPSDAARKRRETAQKRVGRVQTILRNFSLPPWQVRYLQAYANGRFESDWAGVPAQPEPTAESLTRAALDGTAGQGFFPGIEGGRILTDPSIYLAPFDYRIDRSALQPGDVTALMAQPWQADFLECLTNWWPSQRPDLAPQPGGAPALPWHRPLSPDDGHRRMAGEVMKFGVVSARTDAGGAEVAFEEGRDPTLL